MRVSSSHEYSVAEKKITISGTLLSRDVIRVVIADTQPIFRNGLMDVISRTNDIAIVEEIPDIRDLMNHIDKKDCDVLILDNSMMRKAGLKQLKDLREKRRDLPILILSTYPEEKFAVRCIKMGAAGYLTRDSAPSHVLDAIRKIFRKGRYINSNVAELLAHEVDRYSNKDPHEKLSEREYQVMLMLAMGNTVKEIAAELILSAKTINTYRYRVLEKMKMKKNSELTFYAIDHQLIE